MARHSSLMGLWVVRVSEAPFGSTLLARVHEELYVLAFSTVARAGACCDALGASGRPFYVCNANLAAVVDDARTAGALGFIVDYDAAGARFSSAHPLPPSAAARELR